MIETKALIVGQVLKFDKPFKLRHVYDELGLSPQTTNNALRRLVDKGVLIKTGTLYSVVNKEALVDELMTNSGTRHLEKVEPIGNFYPRATAEMHQDFVDAVVRARVLDKPQASEMHYAMNQNINEMIEQMKRLKKWLNSKQYTMSRAADGFSDRDWDFVVNHVLGDNK